MNCLEFRQLKLSDPYSVNPGANAHRDECEACRRFEQEIRTLDKKVNQALAIPLPENLAARILLKQSLQREHRGSRRWYWVGLAASIVLAVGLLLSQGESAEALQGKIAAHLDHEQAKVDSMHAAVDNEQIADVLDYMGVSLDTDANPVVFARLCIMDYRLVVHLVIESDDGRFTILLMPQSVKDARREFAAGNWRGVILPQEFGSMAIVAREGTPTETLDRIARQYGNAFPDA